MADPKTLTELRLTNFRCFDTLRFAPATATNFILGANAQGKTSILESVCVLLRLQSPRTNSLAETVRSGTGGFGIDGRVSGAHLHFRFEPPHRQLTLDSIPQSGSREYLRVGRVAWFSNDDIEIVRGSGSRRRRYLDFLCSQLDATYLPRFRAYEKALRSRNALLKDGRPRREIAAFDGPLVENGAGLMMARAAACAALALAVKEAAWQIGGNREPIELRYEPGAEGDFASALAVSAPDELRLRQTTVGPHRDDFTLVLDGLAAARFASEGQQRTLALALKLAQIRLIEASAGAAPILLVDDIFGELDVGRRKNLLAHLPSHAQKLITTTHLGWLEDVPDSAIFELADHRLTRRSQ